MSTEIKKEEKNPLNTKKMLKEEATKGTKIKFSDRVEIEIAMDTKHFRKGDKLKVHSVVADRYVKDKMAKIVK